MFGSTVVRRQSVTFPRLLTGRASGSAKGPTAAFYLVCTLHSWQRMPFESEARLRLKWDALVRHRQRPLTRNASPAAVKKKKKKWFWNNMPGFPMWGVGVQPPLTRHTRPLRCTETRGCAHATDRPHQSRLVAQGPRSHPEFHRATLHAVTPSLTKFTGFADPPCCL